MPRVRTAVIAALVATVSSGCNDGVHPTATGDTVAPVIMGIAAASAADPLLLLSAQMKGDVLELKVEYGGGCAEHEFALYHDAVFRESHPVQVGARLSHESFDDLCRALVQQTLQFDMTRLKRRWQATYRQVAGSMTVHVGAAGHEGPQTLAVRYDFER